MAGQITVALEGAQDDWIDYMARRYGLTRSAVVRMALDRMMVAFPGEQGTDDLRERIADHLMIRRLG